MSFSVTWTFQYFKSSEESSRTYYTIKKFLIKRYSVIDVFTDRLYLEWIIHCRFIRRNSQLIRIVCSCVEFKQKFAIKNLKQELLVSKFISLTTGRLFVELRLRRPDTLSKFVQIANSISASTACAYGNHKRHFGMEKWRFVCVWPNGGLRWIEVQQLVKKYYCCERLPVCDSPIGQIEWSTSRLYWTHLTLDIAPLARDILREEKPTRTS